MMQQQPLPLTPSLKGDGEESNSPPSHFVRSPLNQGDMGCPTVRIGFRQDPTTTPKNLKSPKVLT